MTPNFFLAVFRISGRNNVYPWFRAFQEFPSDQFGPEPISGYVGPVPVRFDLEPVVVRFGTDFGLWFRTDFGSVRSRIFTGFRNDSGSVRVVSV